MHVTSHRRAPFHTNTEDVMTFIETPQCVQVKLIMEQNAVPIVNVWHVDTAVTVDSAILTLVANVFDSWVTTSYAPEVHNSVDFKEIIATDQTVPNGQQIIIPTTATAGGTGGAAAPANAALVASFRTALTGRNFRGRTYVPGMSNTNVTDAQHISLGYANNLNDVFQDLLDALTNVDCKLVVLSRFLNNVARAAGVMHEILTIITNTKIDSQRRRTAN